MDDFTDKEWRRPVKRPIGVYVIAFFAAGIGFLNFISYFIQIRTISDVEIPLVVILITLAIPLFTSGAAIWMFMGQNEGRIVFLSILPANILWFLVLSVLALVNDSASDDEDAVLIIFRLTIWSLFVIAIEWYLLSSAVAKYFHQNVND